ncbi:MAG: PAS domain-containing protein [Alicyclobacillus sp.]|nr:PAS domain-containing protein [Alicyclobacillus sp.]
MIPLDLLHGLFDALPDAMVLLRVEEDGKFRYERASRYAYVKGLFSEGHIGKLVVEAHPPEYASYLQDKYRYAAESKNPVVFNDLVLIQGQSVLQQAVVTPVIDGAGRCQYLIAEISKEVDGATAQRVQATRKIFESFFDNTRDRVVMVRHGDKQIEVTGAVLRSAMNNEQLFAEYQPLMCPRTDTVKGVEALVRWNHPDFGQRIVTWV